MANHYFGKRAAGRKPVGKRALSLLMALVMSLSLVQITAFAVETTGTTQKDAAVVFRGGSNNDGTVEVSKTVEKAAGTNDFEITLQVTVPKDQTIETGKGANVVLVMDRSNSMAGKGFENAKKAATAFVNKLMEKGGNKVAVVGFGNNYEVSSELTGDKSAALKAVDAATKPFNNDNNGGTNIQAGIYAARNILADHKDEQNFIIVFSDGKPTFSYQSTITGQWKGCSNKYGPHFWNDWGKGHIDDSLNYTNFKYTESFKTRDLAGNGRDYSYAAWRITVTCEHGKQRNEDVWANNGVPAIMEAGLAKDAGAVIYSVYVGKDQEATDTMKKVASDGKYYSSDDMGKLAELFGGIVEEVIATTAKSVVDPMGAQIVLGDVSNLAGVTKTEDGLTWNPTAEGVKCTENEDGSKTYEVTYPITLNTDAATGFVAEKAYKTNGKTTFTYSVDKKEYTIDFPIPTVKGYLPETEPSVMVGYKVIHQYYGADGKHIATMDEEKSGTAEVGTTITSVNLINKDGYHWTSTTSLTVSAAADADNTIYVRYDADEVEEQVPGEYTVVHKYFTNDNTEPDGEYSYVVSTAMQGDVVTAANIAQLTEYNGNTYEYIESDPESIVVDDTATKTITLIYHRTSEVEPEKKDGAYLVKHEYYTNGELDGFEAYTVVTVYVGDEVKAEDIIQRPVYDVNGETYAFDKYVVINGVEETDKDYITVTANATDNTIVLRYTRTVEIEPEPTTYTVIHEYYTNNEYDGKVVDEEIAGKVGEGVGVTTCTWKQTYDGNGYGSPTATPSQIVLVEDAKANVITLRYDRTTSTPVNPPVTTYDYYTVTVNYLDKDSGAVIHEKYSTTQREHTTYDVTAQDKIAIEGYTYVETSGDALTGTLNGNKVINVYYSKTTDIDDGDTPTTPAEPGSDIGDDDVPTTPAQPPKTGDSMGLWIAAAMVSGMGLVWLALSGKKREERA